MERFKDLQNRARDAGKGLWAATYKTVGIGGRPPGAKLDIPIRTKTDVSEVIVYATKTGKKYHKGSCRYLKKSRIPMKLADAKKVLTPCGSCRPPKAGPYPDRWRRRPTGLEQGRAHRDPIGPHLQSLKSVP